MVSGATGLNERFVNGLFKLSEEVVNGAPVWKQARCSFLPPLTAARQCQPYCVFPTFPLPPSLSAQVSDTSDNLSAELERFIFYANTREWFFGDASEKASGANHG